MSDAKRRVRDFALRWIGPARDDTIYRLHVKDEIHELLMSDLLEITKDLEKPDASV